MDSIAAHHLVQSIMKGGRKAVAEKILARSFDIVHKKTKQAPLTVVHQALSNVKPTLDNKSLRIGHRVVRVPTPLDPQRSLKMATKWIVEAARDTGGNKPMSEKLAAELLENAAGRGAAVNKRKEVYKTAVANRTFLRYRR